MSTFQRLATLLIVIGMGVAVGSALSNLSEQAASGSSSSPSEADDPLPKDVYPDSRNRLPRIKREDLDEVGKKAYDSLGSDPRSLAGSYGPGQIRLYSPRLAGATPEVRYLRYETDLGRRLTELAILVTARELNQEFEWFAHEPEARRQHLEAEIIDVVRLRKSVAGLGEKEAVIIQLGREVFGDRRVISSTFARALKLFGPKSLVDLVSLMGHYSATAVLLTTFDQHLPPGKKSQLPIP